MILFSISLKCMHIIMKCNSYCLVLDSGQTGFINWLLDWSPLVNSEIWQLNYYTTLVFVKNSDVPWPEEQLLPDQPVCESSRGSDRIEQRSFTEMRKKCVCAHYQIKFERLCVRFYAYNKHLINLNNKRHDTMTFTRTKHTSTSKASPNLFAGSKTKSLHGVEWNALKH